MEAPAIPTQGTWHRHVLLLDVGNIATTFDVSDQVRAAVSFAPTHRARFCEQTVDPDAAADIRTLMKHPLMLVGGLMQPNSTKFLTSYSMWSIHGLMVDLLPPDDDLLDGGTGNDFLVGQRGDVRC